MYSPNVSRVQDEAEALMMMMMMMQMIGSNLSINSLKHVHGLELKIK